MPPESDIINIACQAQQRVEATVPVPPAVSRTPSSASLQQQLVPAIEMVLSSTVQSPSKLLQFGRSVVGQKLKSQLSGLSGGWHKPAPANDGLVFYRPSDSPSPTGSSEQLATPQPAETNGKMPSPANSQTDVSSPVDNIQSNDCDVSSEVNLIDLSFEDSGEKLVTSADSERGPSEVDLAFSSTVNVDRALDHEVNVTDDLVELQSSTTSRSDGSPVPPAILLNDGEGSGVRADRPLCRRHSLLKISHSESSLSMSLSTPPPAPQGASSAHDVRELDMDDVDVDLSMSSAVAGTSGFSRLLQGGKLAASLMVPRGSGMSAAAAASRRRQLEELAKNRLVKSQLRFKECRTRIILL